jgi:pyruvate/2-oxoglutarate dehydrogenase complex dihydrolipoamide acyltransferase (E2) component
MALIDIQVPDIGDFDEVTVIELMVKVGDTVKSDQSLITVESDKASMEIPCSHGGVVKELKVKLGDKVKQGSVVLVLEGEGAAAAPAAALPAVPAPAPLAAPPGFRLAVPAEVVTGTALVGRTVLFHWPTAGWVRGTVGRRSRAAGFSHVVRYGPRSALGAAVVASLLDAASHGPGGRWVLLFPTRPPLSL